ncbi:MAG TPA: hypothetical protein DEQ03_12220 [Marinilabiliales bacterium]|nr:hypothetical protein [Marinilabiliales bacterium]
MFEEFKGYSDGHQFRLTNRYLDTQKLFEILGLSEEVENRTPTVGVNIAHLAKMWSIQSSSREITGKDLNVTILGISSAKGPKDFQRLLKGLGAGRVSTVAVDISDGIFEEIKQSGLDEIQCFQRDARETSIPANSQDFVLRDHIGNCCPPAIDRAIDEEAFRILKPRGIAIVNITTSDEIQQSEGRVTIPFSASLSNLGSVMISAFQQRIYDLDELKRFMPVEEAEQLRGTIIGIEENDSFVVFGEDQQGHGEWFRTWQDHIQTWQRHGFHNVEVQSRRGLDSHDPPLKCVRLNVVLQKPEGS